MVVFNSEKVFEITKEMEEKCQEILNYIIKKLKLKHIKLIFNDFEHTCYNNTQKYISINKNEFDYKGLAWMHVKFKNPKLYLLFILFHELGHHIQATKYNKWFAKFKTNNKIFGSHCFQTYKNNLYIINKEYQKLKLESNSNKLAMSMIKRFYPEVLDNII